MVSVNKITATILQQLAPTGVLRAAVNLSNPLLVEQSSLSLLPNLITGLSPSFAAAIAHRLNVPLKLVPYEHPDTICTAAEEWQQQQQQQPQQENQPWDITLIAADSDRELQGIDFTSAYCEIQATCMVPTSSCIRTFNDVNKEGVRLSTKGGGAYDLWVTRNWNQPTIVRSRTLEESYLTYINDVNDNDDVGDNDGLKACLAGLRPRLVEDLERDKAGHRLLEGSFMSVEQAIGCMKVNYNDDDGTDTSLISPGHNFLQEFVEESRAPGGLIEELIQKHGMIGRLSLPSSSV